MLNSVVALFNAGAAPAAAGDYESIATVSVGATSVSSIEFTSIPGTFKHLQLRAAVKMTGNYWMTCQINGDTSTNYVSHGLYGNGSTVSTLALPTGSDSQAYLAQQDGASNQVIVAIIDFLDYANTTTNKTARCLWGTDRNGGGSVGLNSMFRPSETGAITSIKLLHTGGGTSFNQYSHFALYGIKGVA